MSKQIFDSNRKALAILLAVSFLLTLASFPVSSHPVEASTLYGTYIWKPTLNTPASSYIPSQIPNPNIPSQTPNTDISSQTPNTDISSQTPNTDISTQTPNTEVSSQTPNTDIPTQTPNTEVSSQTPNTEVSSQTPNTDIPSQTPNTEVSSQTPNTEVSSQTPNTDIPSQTPNTEVSSQTPNTNIPTQTPNTEVSSQTPNPNISSQTPNSNVSCQILNPKLSSQIPNPNIPSQTPNPNVPSQILNPNIPSQTPNPNVPSQILNPNVPSQILNPNIPSQTPNPNVPSQILNPNIPSQTPNPNFPSQILNPNVPSQILNPNVPSQIPNFNIPSQTPNPITPRKNSGQTPHLSISRQNFSPMSDTMTELTSSANKYTLGQTVTLTAIIGTPSKGVKNPSGTVTFIDGTLAIGTETVNSGQAILATSVLSVGSHSITVQYSGDNNFKPSTSSIFTLVVLDKLGSDQLPGSPENPMVDTKIELTSAATEYVSGQPITFTAKVDTISQGTDKPSGTVTFIDEKTQIGAEAINSGQTILTTSELSVGSHSITAQYSGNNNFKPSTSTVFTLTVKKDSLFHHPLFPMGCGIIATIIVTVVGGFIRTKLRL